MIRRGLIFFIFTFVGLTFFSGNVLESYGLDPYIRLTPEDNIVVDHSLDIHVYYITEEEFLPVKIIIDNLNQSTDNTQPIELRDPLGIKDQIKLIKPGTEALDEDCVEQLFICKEADDGDVIRISLADFPGFYSDVIFNASALALGPNYPTGTIQQISESILDVYCPDVDGDGIREGDVDGDNICDVWEDDGTDRIVITHDFGNGPVTYIYDCMRDPSTFGKLGCSPDIKDVFIELDYMEGHNPDLDAVGDAFKVFSKKTGDQKAHLHIQVDQTPAINHDLDIIFPGTDFDGDPMKGFDQIKGDQFGTDKEKNDSAYVEYGEWNADNPIRKLKHQIFHYGLLVHEWENNEGTSGIGEIDGNDFMISLGSFSGQVGSRGQQAGTLIHELGHNLGLDHGGFEEKNNKPNYFSVMTHLRQMPDPDPNRPLDYSGIVLGYDGTGELKEGDLYEGWHYNQQNGQPPAMDVYPGHNEGVIYFCPNGNLGPLYYKAGTHVNWDCDGTIDKNTVSIDINGDGQMDTLKGYNDWDNLHFDFTEFADFQDGVHVSFNQGVYRCQNNQNTDFTSNDNCDISIQVLTKFRIAHLLSLYAEILKIDPSEFNLPGFVSFEDSNSIPEISFVQLLAPNPTPPLSLPGPIFDESKFENTLTQDYGVPIIGHISAKELFLKGTEQAIKQINLHDLQGTRSLAIDIGKGLEKSLSHEDFKEISPIIGNLILSYDKALEFSYTSIHNDPHKPVSDPIVNQKWVDTKINDVTDYYTNIDGPLPEVEKFPGKVSIPSGTSVPGCETKQGCFVPHTIVIGVGEEVEWSNDDTAAHTVTGGGASDGPSGVFDSSLFMAGTTFSHTFEAEGNFPYFCMVHPWMEGIVTVQAEGADDLEDDEELMVSIRDSAVKGGTRVDLELSELHVNYEITATQNGEVIYQETRHAMEMTDSIQVDAVGSEENPIDIEIVSLGVGVPGAEKDWTGPVGKVATAKVVPEFGTVAMMILAVSIISIVAITAKSRVIPKL